ncbi:hypothetical protein HAX54_038613 [Datura stramonium]|uniref:Uncharacterized protein n=1 Tax=Datura stramonium TaxID=4076 RepID=A0ABS8VNG5_DATST|nr:hypothetical protein [Datura stramonium]
MGMMTIGYLLGSSSVYGDDDHRLLVLPSIDSSSVVRGSLLAARQSSTDAASFFMMILSLEPKQGHGPILLVQKRKGKSKSICNSHQLSGSHNFLCDQHGGALRHLQGPFDHPLAITKIFLCDMLPMRCCTTLSN